LAAVWRFVLIFAAAVVVANPTGAWRERADTECGDGEPCPPSCPTCTCAWHWPKIAPSPIFEARARELTSRCAELPAATMRLGQRAPAPSTRPPIA
jgi:hypothetical protein